MKLLQVFFYQDIKQDHNESCFPFQVQAEIKRGDPAAYATRDKWDAYDPNLVAEALFATANIFSTLKLVYMFTVNAHLGPLQISLGRMLGDILKFSFLVILVIVAFACGINQLYWYYAAARQKECKECNEKHDDNCDQVCSRVLAK